MHGCWVAFIKTGAPQCQAGGREWPAYDGASDELMEFSLDPGVRQHFRKRELDAQEAAAGDLLAPR
jgi:para-nitrobenzyl esterase